jgi:hypothetical protein
MLHRHARGSVIVKEDLMVSLLPIAAPHWLLLNNLNLRCWLLDLIIVLKVILKLIIRLLAWRRDDIDLAGCHAHVLLVLMIFLLCLHSLLR